MGIWNLAFYFGLLDSDSALATVRMHQGLIAGMDEQILGYCKPAQLH